MACLQTMCVLSNIFFVLLPPTVGHYPFPSFKSLLQQQQQKPSTCCWLGPSYSTDFLKVLGFVVEGLMLVVILVLDIIGLCFILSNPLLYQIGSF